MNLQKNIKRISTLLSSVLGTTTMAIGGLMMVVVTFPGTTYSSVPKKRRPKLQQTRSSLPFAVQMVEEVKYPNSPLEGNRPVITHSMAFSPLDKTLGGNSRYGGFNELLPYVLASPNQEDAGSCLYMSMTGIAEWWLAYLHPKMLRNPNGPLDLSERYLMNIAGMYEQDNGVANWKTDTILLFNRTGYALKNRLYPFTKGHYVQTASGRFIPSASKTPKSEYGTSYNWISQFNKVAGGKVSLPRFYRRVLLADPSSNQWNTGVAPSNIVAVVKNALKKNKAPISVIYNHYGYWHANVIVGYDDELSHNCSFVRNFFSYMKKEVGSLQQQAANMRPGPSKTQLLTRAQSYANYRQRAYNSYRKAGGCQNKGMFYVRDSLYRDESAPMYDYDKATKGEEAPYTKKIVLREYEWLQHMSNHAVQVYVLQQK